MNLPEFQQLNLKYVRRVSENEYSASCPRCGGEPHRGGELPDRFRVWLKSRATGGIVGWCRQCGYTWTPKGERIEQAVHAEWIDERKAYEQDRIAKAEHALELLQREQVWVRYAGNVNGEIRQRYYDRGLNDYWILYWTLGYNPDKVIWDRKNGKEHHTPTLTIPVFEPEAKTPITIRNRLLNPIDVNDKYRPEYSGLPTSLYYANLDTYPKNKVLIVEGEFKAMTTYIAYDDPDMFVVGTPGKTPSQEIFAALNACDVVYILLDPDAYVKQTNDGITPVRRIVNLFKDKSRVISLPYKVDDMITSNVLDKKALHNLVNTARKMQWNRSKT